MTPGVGLYFCPQGHDLINLGRGPLGDAAIQIQCIKALALWFQTKKSFKVFISKIVFSLCDLDMQRIETI